MKYTQGRPEIAETIRPPIRKAQQEHLQTKRTRELLSSPEATHHTKEEGAILRRIDSFLKTWVGAEGEFAAFVFWFGR